MLSNPCPAELFQTIFHSFKAGIANPIPIFNDEKYCYLSKIDISGI